MRILVSALMAVTVTMASPSAAYAAKKSKESSGQKAQNAAVNDVPKCSRKLGSVSIANGDDPYGWTQFNLGPPAKLLKLLVQRSGCFTLVDRGAGLNAAELERNIGSNLGLQRKSNVGQGQIKAADYVLIAEIQGANNNVSGGGAGAAIGGLLGGRVVGGLLGGIRSKKMEANTVLSLTNVRTTETLAVEEGYAIKKDTSFALGGVLGGAGAVGGGVGGGYDNTDIGKVVTLSFIQAYANLVTGLGLVTPGSEGTAEAAPAKTFTAMGSIAMRKTASASGAVIRTLEAGSIVYPTGNKAGLWWEIADENDNVGWVLNTKLEPSR